MASIGQRTDNGKWFVQWYEPVRRDDGTVRAVARRRVVKKNTEEAAIKLKQKIERELAEAQLEDEKPETGPVMTLEQLSDLYQARMQLENPNAWRAPEWAVLLRYLGPKTPIDSIDLSTVEQMAERMSAAGLHASTINRKRAALRHGLRWAAARSKETGLAAFPLDAWKRLNEAKTRRPWVFYSADELRKIRKVLGDELVDLAILIAIETGMRMGEILDLRPRDLRPGRLFARESKHGNPRWIPIPGTLEKRIRANLRGVSPEARLFAAAGVSRFVLGKAWGTRRASARVREGRFHDLRHTFISRALAAGVGLWRAKYLAGHKSITSTMVYAHFAEEPERMEPVSELEAAKRNSGRTVVRRRARKRRPAVSGARSGT